MTETPGKKGKNTIYIPVDKAKVRRIPVTTLYLDVGKMITME